MSGGSRGNKYERDHDLLLKDLERDPNNSRTVYYLAQTLKDLGGMAEAGQLYERRVDMGGWGEEAWHAQLMAARCYGTFEADAELVFGLLKAYSMRPWRAEPLLSLATHYRNKGSNDLAVMFAKQGMAVPYPSHDILFVEQEAYHDGFKQELSIAGFYAGDREDGHAACEELATRRGVPEVYRRQARWNLQFYAKPLAALALSAKSHRLSNMPGTMNPSVVCTPSGRLLTTIRHVNYTISPDGSYVMNPGDSAIKTRNYLWELDPETFAPIGTTEIEPPLDWPSILYPHVLGFEDIRLFTTDDHHLRFIATVRDIDPNGICTPVIGTIGIRATGDVSVPFKYRMTDCRVLKRSWQPGHEKNWMPVDQGQRLIYSCDPTIVLTHEAELDCTEESPGAFDNWRGSSQLIPFIDGGWLAIIHEVDQMPGAGERSYQHRFVFFNQDFRITRWSRRFYLQRRGIEFVAGLCWHPTSGNLIISWGANRDSEAWVGTISADDVDSLMMYN